MTATYLVGDVFDVMATLPDASVDLVLTSPPFLALRSYLPPDHPDKAKEIGSEPTPAEFLDTLLALTAEWGRLLAPHGSICVELGDTYAGSGGSGGDYAEGGMRDGQPAFSGSSARSQVDTSEAYGGGENRVGTDRWEGGFTGRRGHGSGGGSGWPLPKSLCGIPHLYHLSLAYGRNLLTGEPSPAGMWRIRNVIAWCRPNPAVGALGDKFRPATSYMTVATRARDRWFDLDAVRHPADPANKRTSELKRTGIGGRTDQVCNPLDENGERIISNPAGAPPLDWWEIPTEAYPGSHYATWPRRLLERPIDAMCPREVCRTCGEPRRRVVGEAEYVPSATNRGGSMMADTERVAEGVNQWTGDGGARASVIRSAPTLGWTDCGHDNYRRGLVLDPFGGSGTTGQVAIAYGRDAVLIDLDERNVELARQRIGMFLNVPERTEAP